MYKAYIENYLEETRKILNEISVEEINKSI